MFLDLRQLPDGADLDADLCIVGAGAAGITIAHELIGRPLSVCLVESGGFELEEETQALYQGAVTALPYFDLDVTRLRYFGGSTNHWGGWCAPLNELDFAPRPWIPHSGWPISRRDLEPWYGRAQAMIEIGPFRYDPAYWEDPSHPFPRFSPGKAETRILQLSEPATNFGERFRAELQQADNIRVLLHANATGIDASAALTEVTGIRLATLDGRRATLRARFIVVACGGLETPRLLLLSNDVASAGLGNQHDLVGRFFMEHPHVVTGSLFATDTSPWHHGLSARFVRDGTLIQAGIATSPAAQREAGTLGYSATFETPVDGEAGYLAWRRLVDGPQEGQMPDGLGTDLWNVVTDIDDVLRGIADGRAGRAYQPPWDLGRPIRLYTRLEQAPNPESRVRLTGERDALGLSRLALDWRLTAFDKTSLRRSQILLGEEFGRLGVARLRLDEWVMHDDNAWPDDLHGGHHHLGTVRMSDDPKHGVVDVDCRVHGMGNLYVAGSAVFPTGGYVNPTLTIIALALRLAGHLKQRLGLG